MALKWAVLSTNKRMAMHSLRVYSALNEEYSRSTLISWTHLLLQACKQKDEKKCEMVFNLFTSIPAEVRVINRGPLLPSSFRHSSLVSYDDGDFFLFSHQVLARSGFLEIYLRVLHALSFVLDTKLFEKVVGMFEQVFILCSEGKLEKEMVHFDFLRSNHFQPDRHHLFAMVVDML
jgi:hypothetical protein